VTPEIPPLDERWRVEVKWLDAGGCEHVIQGSARHHDEVRSIAASAIEVLDALDEILRDGEPVPEPAPPSTLSSGQPVETLRDLWHWSVSWAAPPHTMTHTAQSWTLSGSRVWNEIADAIEDLLDLREVLRMTRRQGPKLLGEPLGGETFDEQLAEYDRRDEDRARRFELTDAELRAHMATRRPPGTPG
jgi:hypothetical protein